MNTNTEPAAEVPIGESGRMIARPLRPAGEPATKPTRKKAAPHRPKAARVPKPRRATPRQGKSSRPTSKTEKLVCRYCGSDNLAPSFKKRRDARCRACFKKRYGSAARGKRAKRLRKTKAAK